MILQLGAGNWINLTESSSVVCPTYRKGLSHFYFYFLHVGLLLQRKWKCWLVLYLLQKETTMFGY